MTKYQGWQKVFFCLSYPLDNDTQRHKREIHYERMCVGKEYDSAQLGKREVRMFIWEQAVKHANGL